MSANSHGNSHTEAHASVFKPQDVFEDGSRHHIMPVGTLQKVAIGLIVLTALTVVLARIHLGIFAAPVAFAIAITKALLVVGYFMGLKFDTKLNRVIFASGFAFLALLYVISVTDIWTRIIEYSPL